MMERALVTPHQRSLGWLGRAVVAGALASIVALLLLVTAYIVAGTVGSSSSSAGTLANWAYHLTNNRVTTVVTALHAAQALGLFLVVGIVWAVIYAALVEPRLEGPGWRKGLVFAILPALLSVLVLLPILGAGVFGVALGAGPLAGLGIVLFHAVYGFVMGEIYGPAVSRAVVAGFLASIISLLVLVAGYGFAAAVGSTDPRAGALALWMYNLAYNRVTTLVTTLHVVQAMGLHLVAGIVWAMVYAAWVEPVLPGPGWRKGLIFAILPALLSIFVLLPILGAGVFGVALGAGPLAGIGVLVLHAVYGMTMGAIYALAEGEGALGGRDNPRARTFTTIERDMTAGLVLGGVLGGIIGLILVTAGLGTSGADSTLLTTTGAATEGAIAGVVVGVFIGLITS